MLFLFVCIFSSQALVKKANDLIWCIKSLNNGKKRHLYEYGILDNICYLWEYK